MGVTDSRKQSRLEWLKSESNGKSQGEGGILVSTSFLMDEEQDVESWKVIINHSLSLSLCVNSEA